MDDILKVFKGLADTLGLAKYPILSSITVGLICGLVSALICYRLLTNPGENAPGKVITTVNKTTGNESPIMPNNRGLVNITGDSSSAQKDPPPK